ASVLEPDSRARQIYGRDVISERHRHRYEVNDHYLPHLKNAGLRIAGLTEGEKLVEMVELPDHPWFMGCQFHPGCSSTAREEQPWLTSFIEAAIESQASAGTKGPACARGASLAA